MKASILKKAKTIKRLTSVTFSRLWKTKQVKEPITPQKIEETQSTSQSSNHVYFEISPMNKSSIVQHSCLKLILKLRDISKNMRKRVKYNLQNRKVILSEARVCNGHVINGWADYHKNYIKQPWYDLGFIKGVSSYTIETEEDKIQIQRLNGLLRVKSFKSSKTKSASYDYVDFLRIYQRYFDSENELVNKSTCKIVGELSTYQVSANQIKKQVQSIQNILFLDISETKLGSLNLSSSIIQKVRLICVGVEGLIQFPLSTSVLTLDCASNFHLIKCDKLVSLRICRYIKLTEPNLNWIKSLDSLKDLKFECDFAFEKYKNKQIPSCFPPNLRHISSGEESKIDLKTLSKACPNLICVDSEMNISDLELINPKNIVSKLNDDVFGTINARPKAIRLFQGNVEAVMNHPEILKEVEKIHLDFYLFDLSRVPPHIKYIILGERFQIRCNLNRVVYKPKRDERRDH